MPPLKLLVLLTWPYVRKHRFRTVLTLAGILLGVALFIGIHTANQSLLRAFRTMVDQVAGPAQLQITAGDTGFAEEVLEKVQTLPEVRAAAPVIEAVVGSGLRGEGDLLVFAVDLLAESTLRTYAFDEQAADLLDDPLLFLAQPDSILISRDFADRTGAHLDSKLVLQTVQGPRAFTVRGILRAAGLGAAYGGSLVVMDLYAAQQAFGRGRTFDRIDVAVRDDVPVEECRRRLQAALGPGFEVDTPSARRRHFEAVTRSLTLSIHITSLFALLIGVFIVYNSFSVAAVERRREIGILRALGATRRSILTLFLIEGVAAGLAGSALGLPAGRLLSVALTGFLRLLVGQAYGLALAPEPPAIETGLLLLGLGLGVVASVVGAVLPAREAARQEPVYALQKGRFEAGSGQRLRLRPGLVAVLLGVAGCLLGTGASLGFYAAYVLTVLATLVGAPWLILGLVRGLRPALQGLRPVEGALAADSLLRSPRRTCSTVSALILALALAVGFAGIAAASRQSVQEWLDSGMTFDLFLSPAAGMTSRSIRFPPSLGEELEQLPGIAEVQPVRLGRVPFRGSQVMLVSADLRKLARRVRFKLVAGDAAAMIRTASAGEGVIVSETLALLHHLRLGDRLELGSAAGPLSLPVVGIHVDYTDQQGSMLIDRALFQRHWQDESSDVFRVFLQPGVPAHDARRRILERFSGRHRLFVMTSAEVKQYVLRTADQWFALTWLQLAVALLVAILDIANSLTVSILDRRRDLGILRAVGAERGQVRAALRMEALALALTGLPLGIALGALLLGFNVHLMRLDAFGYRWDYVFPFSFALLLWPLILGAAVAASWWPAESAVRTGLVEALEYE